MLTFDNDGGGGGGTDDIVKKLFEKVFSTA